MSNDHWWNVARYKEDDEVHTEAVAAGLGEDSSDGEQQDDATEERRNRCVQSVPCPRGRRHQAQT